eukprot:1662494-Lingulodinium_polyedra.AAC.1
MEKVPMVPVGGHVRTWKQAARPWLWLRQRSYEVKSLLNSLNDGDADQWAIKATLMVLSSPPME